MRASHKKRIVRLVVALDAAEAAARDRRWELRVLNCICKDIRAAMEWRGIDPASSRVLLDEEAKLVGFVDTLELLAADLDFEDDADEQDPAGDDLVAHAVILGERLKPFLAEGLGFAESLVVVEDPKLRDVAHQLIAGRLGGNAAGDKFGDRVTH